MDCEWVVVMDMGTEPEVIEPETTEEPAEPEKEER